MYKKTKDGSGVACRCIWIYKESLIGLSSRQRMKMLLTPILRIWVDSKKLRAWHFLC